MRVSVLYWFMLSPLPIPCVSLLGFYCCSNRSGRHCKIKDSFSKGVSRTPASYHASYGTAAQNSSQARKFRCKLDDCNFSERNLHRCFYKVLYGLHSRLQRWREPTDFIGSPIISSRLYTLKDISVLALRTKKISAIWRHRIVSGGQRRLWWCLQQMLQRFYCF